MNFSLEVNVEFDILDAAIHECLPGYAPRGWVEFNRIIITPVSVRYDLFLEEYGDLGNLGSIAVRKIDVKKSVMDFHNPEKPAAKSPSQEEWDSNNFSQYSKEERIAKKLDLFKKYQDEAENLFQKRKEHQERIIQALFSRLANDSATQHVFSEKPVPEQKEDSPLDEARVQLQDFRNFVERQAYKDLYDENGAQEKYARSVLQAFLTSRSYREIPVRAGRSDILVPLKDGRLLYEAKIWRGESYHLAGLEEIAEYIVGENSDGKLFGVFYVVFDPSKTHQALKYVGSNQSVKDVHGFPVEIFVVSLAPDTPSKKSSA